MSWLISISSYGASGVWVGTRFVASVEAGASKKHKELVLSAGYDDVIRTLIYSGRPMSVRKTPYVENWWLLFVSRLTAFTHIHMTGKQRGVEKSKNLSSKEKYLMKLSFSNTRKNLSKDYLVSTLIKCARLCTSSIDCRANGPRCGFHQRY